MADLGVIILTRNEERHIRRAIDSVAKVAREILVVDSGSTDRTVELAEAAGARVRYHPWINHADQFRWAMENGALTSGWLMRLDADEIVEPDLAEEIGRRLGALPEDVGGVFLNRRHVFMGRFIRHGGRFPMYLLRIWRAGAAHIEQRWMDEHIVLDRGRAVLFSGGFADVNLSDLGQFTDKHNRYATAEAVEVLGQRLGLFAEEREVHGLGLQARVKRLIKVNVFNRLGIGVGPAAYFTYRYVAQLGFLDGREGLIYHFLQGFWYRFLVEAKVCEFERALAGMKTREARLSELARLTGLRL